MWFLWILIVIIFYIISSLLLLKFIKPSYNDKLSLYEQVLNIYTFPIFYIGLLIVSRFILKDLKIGNEFKNENERDI